jgi:flavodoxin
VKAIVVYNTRSGNTKELAEKMKIVLVKYNHKCDVFRDKEIKKTPEIVEKYDVVAIGSPTHGNAPARSPFRGLVKEIVKRRIDGKKLICFATSAGEENWRKVCSWISEKLVAMDHVGDIGCVKHDNEEAITSFEKLVKKL